MCVPGALCCCSCFHRILSGTCFACPPWAPRKPVWWEILRANFSDLALPVRSGSPGGATQPPPGDPGDEMLTIPRGSLVPLGERLSSRKFSIVQNPKQSPQNFPLLGN